MESLREQESQIPSIYPSLDSTSSTLVQVVQQLSLAHSLEDVMKIVRTVARKLVNADGATFVLRENEQCYYADEDAISPLWKGMRFPLRACISGWSMLHKEQLCISDIYKDSRIPHDVYKPTFIHSLAMTPIRKKDPIGAIGTYWAKSYTPTAKELDALQAVADATSIVINDLAARKSLDRVRISKSSIKPAYLDGIS
ncbi:GAF domain-containing protein [Spartinivicinus ruber]|uniref:GAF domain-containing protein n=1 Tax=Spartinivicinus ruber TaxID=2683272 RepID=UPI0013D4C840|nr:GAF domain-containing protein [Spartinivicinus ruber]